jgi:NAD(P)-dependent dehydrogenase (short-subunit alcohol dehydrogenase family)
MTTGTGRFAGYGVLITGAARGIGAATAARFAEEGARVLIADADPEAGERTARRLRDRGLAVEAVACDVTGQASVEAAVAHAVRRFGSLDVLVNNAAHCTPDAPRFEDEPEEEWAADLDVTLTGAYRCCRAALAHLEASVGSVNGLQDFGNHAYSAAKAGLISLTRTLAGHAGPRGVRVNLVAPGTVRTRAWDGRDDDLAAVSQVYPLRRIGEPEDIAAAVTFLASRDAAWITGATLVVDGGITAVNHGFHRAVDHTGR